MQRGSCCLLLIFFPTGTQAFRRPRVHHIEQSVRLCDYAYLTPPRLRCADSPLRRRCGNFDRPERRHRRRQRSRPQRLHVIDRHERCFATQVRSDACSFTRPLQESSRTTTRVILTVDSTLLLNQGIVRMQECHSHSDCLTRGHCK